VTSGQDDNTGAFDAVASRLRLPFGPPELVEKIVSGAAGEVGKRTLHLLITTWDAAGGGPFAASAIGTVGVNKAVDILQEMFMTSIFDRLLRALRADKVRLRASLCASQLVGLGIMRYAARTEPLASTDVDTLVEAVAPTLQRYLVGDIG
jgi:hypothetical protein